MEKPIEEKPSEKIVGMLAKQLHKKPEDVKPSMRIKEDLGADSLDIVELLMKIEDQYGIQVPDEVAMGISTIADLIAVVEKMAK